MNISKILPVFLIFTTPFALVSAEMQGSSVMSLQDQIVNQINSIFHVKSGLSLELSKKQIVEYPLIGSIALVIIVVIASSARSKSKKQIKK
ncbi:hypothetical protein DYY66_2232 [Candidatus Nitrosotalea sp. FS]|uniref:hypothetical protein n=1 Tax=Candidatus Nitrosotalea sp. FS TaxID=2341021 RepID=UPI00140B3576|nr:hypothetical protein [Candidatus Nitrosotalea sp. FS]NHH97485.1 hypothetical protein [Candidatus Nitrosotalea sp. FS]